MVERLRHAPDWAAEDLPVEMIQTHISVVLLGKRRALNGRLSVTGYMVSDWHREKAELPQPIRSC